MERKYLLEKLAAIEHEQWMEWSQDISTKEKLSERRLTRWQSFWIPYSQLDEKNKDSDRKYANKIIEMLVIEGLVEFER